MKTKSVERDESPLAHDTQERVPSPPPYIPAHQKRAVNDFFNRLRSIDTVLAVCSTCKESYYGMRLRQSVNVRMPKVFSSFSSLFSLRLTVLIFREIPPVLPRMHPPFTPLPCSLPVVMSHPPPRPQHDKSARPKADNEYNDNDDDGVNFGDERRPLPKKGGIDPANKLMAKADSGS